MLNKIRNEIDEFTSEIKDVEGCDKLLTYMNESIYSAIKLLMYVSKTFSLYGRVILFFIISLAGLIILSTIGAIGLNSVTFQLITLVVFVLYIVYIIHFKNYLLRSIIEAKNLMNES